MYISRAIENPIIDKLIQTRKAIIIYGARQVGKTTLVEQLVNQMQLKTLIINADQQKYIDILSSRDLNKMRSLVYGYELLVIDEAQRIPDIGINLKILIDEMPELKIIATGSSSFELANRVAEPLTGRTWTYTLYPVSVYELSKMYNPFELDNKIGELLVFGSYPEILTLPNYRDKQKLLEEIGLSYLYKDVFELTTIKHPNKVKDLLKLLSFQIGSEVSVLELSNALGISREAIERYLYLLEKTFVIFRVSGFSRNLRKEVSKLHKIYFYDLGIRNLVIDNFKLLSDRNDIGHLWENFLMIERKKLLSNKSIRSSSYFWRVHTGAEIDYIEEREGGLMGYEFKFKKSKVKPPKSWLETYDNAGFKLINRENYWEFLNEVK